MRTLLACGLIGITLLVACKKDDDDVAPTPVGPGATAASPGATPGTGAQGTPAQGATSPGATPAVPAHGTGGTVLKPDPPTLPTALPSGMPTAMPSGFPTAMPSGFPTAMPSGFPTALPSGITVPTTFPTIPPRK